MDGADTTGSAAIFHAVRDRICTTQLPFAAVLREAELAREFGVSRTPVRQALHQLAAFGLVQTRNGVGTLVTAGDPDTLDDIYDLRIRLAGLIGDLAIGSCPAAPAAQMGALSDRIAAVSDPPEARAFWRINKDRHAIVNALIENRELRGLHDLYYFKVAPFWFSLFEADPQQEFDLLARELSDTAFWMQAGDMQAVARVQANHTALAARRLRAMRGR